MVAEAAGYARRNISDTLTTLASARFVTSYERGNENRYYLNRAAWGQFFEFQPDTWPTYRDWPRLLRALRRIARWLERPDLDTLSEYMLASEARTFADQIESILAIAGTPIAPLLPLTETDTGMTSLRLFSACSPHSTRGGARYGVGDNPAHTRRKCGPTRPARGTS